MSVDAFVFLRDENLPTVQQWQAALDLANTEITLDSIDDLRGHVGYFPAKHRGHDSGFEWYYGPLREFFGGSPPDGLNGREHVVNFVLHSDMRELACAMISGAVLADIADGLVLDEGTGLPIGGQQALTAARLIENDI